MKVDISDVLKAVGNELSIDEEEKVSFPEDNLILSKPVKVKAHIVNTRETVLLTGKITAQVKLNCVRCLKDFDNLLEINIEEEFNRKPPQKIRGKKEVHLTEEDFVFQVGPNNTIDLTEMIRQNLLTALPIKPLCNNNCKGVQKDAAA